MSTFAASTSDKPPSSPSMLSSLPYDIVLTIIARVPRRYYLNLYCVSKTFQKLVRSPELQKTRSLLGLGPLYICFIDEIKMTVKWFTLRGTKNHFTSIDFPSPPELNYSSSSITPEKLVVYGSCLSSSIYDPSSRNFLEVSTKRDRFCNYALGLLVNESYAIKGFYLYTESFNLKKKIWESAPNPKKEECDIWNRSAHGSLDKKVYALCVRQAITKGGSVERFLLPEGKWWKWWKTGVCAVENVLYVYFAGFGLAWYDTKVELWRVVNGLSRLENFRSVGMTEYNGKMAFLWEVNVSSESDTKELWCRMIVLDKSGVGIRGTAEPSRLLGVVPRWYYLEQCMSLAG